VSMWIVGPITEWFAKWWEWLRTSWNLLGTWISKGLEAVKLVGVLAAAAGLALYRAIISGLSGLFDSLSTFTAQTDLSNPAPVVVEWLEKGNAFLPIDALFAAVVGLVVLRVVVGLVRWVLELLPG